MDETLNDSVVAEKTEDILAPDLINGDEMALSEHIEEFSQRLIFCVSALVITTLTCFADIRQIVKVFQAPAVGIKFLQFAPGEYFFRIHQNSIL